MGWTGFMTSLTAFYLLHAIPVRPSVRPHLVSRLGQRGFGLAYSALSIVLLAAVFRAADLAPVVPLWSEPPGAHWLVLCAMIAAALVLAFGLFRPNPFSFGGSRNDYFDPRCPGLLRWIRHPVLFALVLWSASHLVVNGDLAHVVMFGSFAGFALIGMRLLDRRRRREWGPDTWRRKLAEIRAGPTTLPHPRNAALRLVGGLAAVLAFILLHPWLAGIPVHWRFLP